MKKPKSRRESKARLLEIPTTMEWLDFQARLNIQISDMLYPKTAKIDYSKFEATYTIPRHVPNALPLFAPTDFSYLLKNAIKAKDPSVKIIVVETGPQSQAQSVISLPYVIAGYKLMFLSLVSRCGQGK